MPPEIVQKLDKFSQTFIQPRLPKTSLFPLSPPSILQTQTKSLLSITVFILYCSHTIWNLLKCQQTWCSWGCSTKGVDISYLCDKLGDNISRTSFTTLQKEEKEEEKNIYIKKITCDI